MILILNVISALEGTFKIYFCNSIDACGPYCNAETKCFPGADIGSGHDLVKMTFCVRLKKIKNRHSSALVPQTLSCLVCVEDS